MATLVILGIFGSDMVDGVKPYLRIIGRSVVLHAFFSFVYSICWGEKGFTALGGVGDDPALKLAKVALERGHQDSMMEGLAG